MSAAPEVSVVIPTRDRWELLAANAIPSALDQEGVALEVIVVDDGSHDGTTSRLRALGDARIRVIEVDVPRGPSAARNVGIQAARGVWVALLDDDDLWSPKKLRLQLDTAVANGSDWVYARSVIVDGERTVIAAPPLADPETVADTLMTGNVIWGGPSNVVAKTSLLRRLGGFDEELECFEDWDMWIRMARASKPSVCREVLVASLDHGDRLLFRYRPDIGAQLETMLARHRPVTRADRLGASEWLAGEYSRAGRRLEASGLYLRAALQQRSAGNVVAALGALFGRRGLEAAARVHLALRGRTHLRRSEPTGPIELPWLSRR